MKRMILWSGLFLATMYSYPQGRYRSADTDLNEPRLNAQQVEMIVPIMSQFAQNTQFAMALIDAGEIMFFGLERDGDKVVSVPNEDSVFEIGSLSKVFTTHLMMNLVKEEKISLGDPIADYLDFPLKGNPRITFGQLASHHSGLPYYPSNLGMLLFKQDNPFGDYSQEKFEKFLTHQLKLKSVPGEKYTYSNVGMALLGYTLGKLTQESYEKALQEEIFLPLHMTQSSSNKQAVEAHIVQGRNKRGNPMHNWDLGALEGAGAILSSVKDLSQYAVFSFDALQGDLALMKERYGEVDALMDIAMGWHIIKEEGKASFLWHNGGTGGYKSSMAIAPDRKDAVIILSNVGADEPDRRQVDELCFRLMKSIE
ncbi:MAG: serine hydrolase domain-containing protein [Bacteroidota bacterium]